MLRWMLSGIAVMVIAGGVTAQSVSRPVAGSVVGKKLIEFGWDEPDTTFMRRHIEQMEKTPFDGCVYDIRCRLADGKETDFIWSAWSKRAFKPEEVQHAIDDLKATKFTRFKYNFLRFNVTPGDVDWFDDYSAVINNARLAARVARHGGVGILFDTEQYQSPLFNYSKQPGASKKTWDEYAAQAHKRGREIMQVFQEEFPGLKILMTFGYGSAPWQDSDAGKRPLKECSYGLFAPFLDGMIEAAEGGSQIIDGWESAYSYFEEKKFRKARKMGHEDVLALVTDPKKYKQVCSVSFGLWMDYRAKEEGWNVEHPERNPHPPAKFERVVRNALKYADEYVWVYTEVPWWWTDKGVPSKLPAAYGEAIRRAATPGTAICSAPSR